MVKMKKDRTTGSHLTVVGKLPEGYVILCELDGNEHSFLAKNLGLSVECPHCGATRCSVDLAQEYFLRRSTSGQSPIGVMARSGPMIAAE
jgi:hypothetical protein